MTIEDIEATIAAGGDVTLVEIHVASLQQPSDVDITEWGRRATEARNAAYARAGRQPPADDPLGL